MYLDQLLNLEEVVSSDGSTSKKFSLNVLLPNALCFASGFLLFYFLIANYIPGVVPKGGN